jgi:hypothetical protein
MGKIRAPIVYTLTIGVLTNTPVDPVLIPEIMKT